ncbi:MAG: aminotransferase class I/II-fold pyridoxal phosphate-dependent enzyme [Pseudomonadota bacterium]
MTKRLVQSPFAGRPLVRPLFQSVVYATDTPDALDAIYEGDAGYTYSREGHPNATAVAGMIDALEGTEGGVMTSSGMAAVSLAMLAYLKAGDHALGSEQLYGRSLRLMEQELPKLGISTSLFDPTDIETAKAAIRPETKVILVEVVANPTLRIADMEGLAALAKQHNITLIVDNTFTTPLAYRPLEHGADVVLHSVTKLMGGHSDAMLGWVAAGSAEKNTRIDGLGMTFGTTAAPFDCWLAERGLLSFELRYERASANAAALAEALAGMKGVKRVLYPTRPDHPDHNRAAALLNGKGGNMVSFELEGGRAAANAFSSAAGMVLAPTLGDITTTVSHPASSSHRAVSVEDQAKLGITEGFFRVSVGVEDINMLTEAFDNAVENAAQA